MTADPTQLEHVLGRVAGLVVDRLRPLLAAQQPHAGGARRAGGRTNEASHEANFDDDDFGPLYDFDFGDEVEPLPPPPPPPLQQHRYHEHDQHQHQHQHQHQYEHQHQHQNEHQHQHQHQHQHEHQHQHQHPHQFYPPLAFACFREAQLLPLEPRQEALAHRPDAGPGKRPREEEEEDVDEGVDHEEEFKEGHETPEATAGRVSPYSGVTSTDSRAGESRKSKLDLHGTILLYTTVAQLGTNLRNERDFVDLWDQCRHYPELASAFKNVGCFKGKLKLRMGERRCRSAKTLWGALSRLHSEAEVATRLRKMAGDAPSRAALKRASVCVGTPVTWDFGPLATMLWAKLAHNEPSPGSVLKWESDVRLDLAGKLVAVHLDSGSCLMNLYQRFQNLVTHINIDLLVFSHCDCNYCADWQLGPSRDAPLELEHRYTVAKAELMKDLLDQHAGSSRHSDAWFADAVKNNERLRRIRHWPSKDILAFLASVHSESHCEVCATQHGKRVRRSSQPHDELAQEGASRPVALPSLDDQEAEVAEDGVCEYDFDEQVAANDDDDDAISVELD